MSNPPAHEYCLQPHVHLAWRGDDIVLLNIDRDEYACIVDGGFAIQEGPRSGTVHIHDANIALDMRRSGLVGPQIPGARRPPPPLPVRALVASSDAPMLDRVGAALSGIEAKMRFSRSTFAELVAVRLPADDDRPLSASPDRARRALTAFETVHPWLPGTGQCLQRAFMLRFHLQRSRVTADWVFGVRTWPFLAHCWIQIGDTVVGDGVERVGGFTPILVV